jgi:hypothetical protein
VFNGLAQVIVQSDKSPGEIGLVASGEGLAKAVTAVRTLPRLDP